MFTEALCSQRRAILIPFRVTVTAGVPALSEGGSMLSIVDGAAGIYAITFGGSRSLGASKRTPVVVVTAVTGSTGDEQIANVLESSILTTGFQVEVNDDTGAAADCSFHGIVVWFDSADEQ